MGEISICNRALGWVGGNRITSLDTSVDTSKEAILCGDNYPLARDVVIEEGGWNFCTKRYLLTPLVIKPPWGYANQFLLGSEVIRVLRVSDSQVNPDAGRGLPWRIEANDSDSRVIMCDAEILYVKAIIRITDTTKFTPGMEMAISARLAMDLAIPIARSNSLQQTMTTLYNNKLRIAMSTENMQGTSERLTNTSLIDARLQGGTIGPTV